MKKLIFSLFLSFIIFLSVSSFVFADSQSEIIQRVDSDIAVSNNLLRELKAVTNDPNAISEVLLREIPIVTQHWNESANFYESKISNESDEELKTILTNINYDVKAMSLSMSKVLESINNGDNDTYSNALDQYDQHTVSLNSNVELLNNHFGSTDYSWLAWPFWISLSISVILFTMSRGSTILPAEQLRNQFEFALFKSSLWPLGGSAISYIWYLMTPPGQKFYILWGLIAFGFFQFLRGLYSYITLARPAINIAKKEEKTKLESLIRSDKFQHDNLKEKAKEIEKLTPIIHIGKTSCGKCGNKNSNEAKFCKSCGNKL